MDGSTTASFFSLPSTLAEWLIGAGVLIVGGFNLFNLFNKEKKQAEDQADVASERVIRLLKEQVEALEKKVNEQEVILRDTNTKLEALIGENKLLREVLQGRDENTINYQNKAMEAINIAPKILDIVTKTDGNVEKLVNSTVKETRTIKTKRI